MKTVLGFLVVIAIGLIVAVLLAVVLLAMNEENSKRCGRCVFFDQDLRICWHNAKLSSKDEYTKCCDSYKEGELR